MIRAIHHTSLAVSDMERALEFYGEGLGFELINDREVEGPMVEKVSGLPGARMRIAHLTGYGQGLELIEYLSPRGRTPAPRPCDAGSAHLCFVVDDIDREKERLEKHGARFTSEPQTVPGGPNAGNRFAYFLDPDGIVGELTQPVRPGNFRPELAEKKKKD